MGRNPDSTRDPRRTFDILNHRRVVLTEGMSSTPVNGDLVYDDDGLHLVRNGDYEKVWPQEKYISPVPRWVLDSRKIQEDQMVLVGIPESDWRYYK